MGLQADPGAHARRGEETLNEWARQQDATPWLRFSTSESAGSDPGELTEAVGDADAVGSTALGMKNLARVADMLLVATTREGEPYDDLEELYGRMLGQWALELTHVTSIVGGYDSQQKHGGQDGVRFVPVPKERQAAAVAFLNEHAFQTPMWAIKAEILRRIEPTGALERIRANQLRVLGSLMNNTRVARLVEQEALGGASSYHPAAFFNDVRHGIWRELDGRGPQIRIDAYRRNLQRGYISLMSDKLNGRQPVTDDSRPFIRGELHR